MAGRKEAGRVTELACLLGSQCGDRSAKSWGELSASPMAAGKVNLPYMSCSERR